MHATNEVTVSAGWQQADFSDVLVFIDSVQTHQYTTFSVWC